MPQPHKTTLQDVQNFVHEHDPDLHEKIIKAKTEVRELQDFGFVTTMFVLAWAGSYAIKDNHRLLVGSLICDI